MEDPSGGEAMEEDEGNKGVCECDCLCIPVHWIKMLSREMHWSFVFGVVSVYGISQGLGGALSVVGTKYYMKDVQKIQPSEAQVYAGITSIPWIVKPLWGILTDVLPIFGYRRRPYFIIAGIHFFSRFRSLLKHLTEVLGGNFRSLLIILQLFFSTRYLLGSYHFKLMSLEFMPDW